MPSPIQPCACTTLRKASRAVTRLYDEALAPVGMTIQQFAILRNVARNPGIALSRLADLLVMERTSLYRALAPLEKQGWLVIAGQGARIKIATVTARGEAAIERGRVPWEAMQARLTDAFGNAEWAALERALSTFTAAATAHARQEDAR